MQTPENVRQMMRAELVGMEPYASIDPPEEAARRLGIPVEQVVKMDGNENPYGCSPRVPQVLGSYTEYNRYPDPLQRVVRQALSEYVGQGPEYIVAGAGSDELIDLLLRLFLEPGDSVVECDPTFGMYRFCTRVCGGSIVSVPRDELFRVDVAGVQRAAKNGAKVVFVTSPNNPTGNITPRSDIQHLVDAGLIVVVDETYYEFCGHTVADLVPKNPNLIVLRSLSKWAGIAGLRIGYGIMPRDITHTILTMKPPFNIAKVAELALLVSLQDRELLLSNVHKLVQERERLYGLLGRVNGVKPLPSEGNYILCRVPSGKALMIQQGLAENGLFVRYYNSSLLQDYIRITVSFPEHTDRLVEALSNLLQTG